MSDPSSAPPPPRTRPPAHAAAIPARHEHLLELEAPALVEAQAHRRLPQAQPRRHGAPPRRRAARPRSSCRSARSRSRRRVRAAARATAARAASPILRRISANAVVPREQGVEGWLWTSLGGSAFPTLCEDDEAPNGALVFAHPLGEDVVLPPLRARVRRRRWPLARRSARPAVYGLLMRFARRAARRRTRSASSTVANPLTDREVGADAAARAARPTSRPIRRCAYTDRARAARSVAPPGLALASLPSQG